MGWWKLDWNRNERVGQIHCSDVDYVLLTRLHTVQYLTVMGVWHAIGTGRV